MRPPSLPAPTGIIANRCRRPINRSRKRSRRAQASRPHCNRRRFRPSRKQSRWTYPRASTGNGTQICRHHEDSGPRQRSQGHRRHHFTMRACSESHRRQPSHAPRSWDCGPQTTQSPKYTPLMVLGLADLAVPGNQFPYDCRQRHEPVFSAVARQHLIDRTFSMSWHLFRAVGYSQSKTGPRSWPAASSHDQSDKKSQRDQGEEDAKEPAEEFLRKPVGKSDADPRG